jgi:hemoglobin
MRREPMATSPAPSAPTPDLSRLRATFTHVAIDRLVTAFYERVRDDALLAPVFADHITDWPTHLGRMNAFWGSVLRAEPGYRAERGSPRELHHALENVTGAHFERWLDLFEQTAREIFEPWAAENVLGRAHRMAVTLSRDSDRPGAPSSTSSRPVQ